MRRWPLILVALMGSIASVAEARSRQIDVLPVTEEVDEDAVAQVLAEAIHIHVADRAGWGRGTPVRYGDGDLDRIHCTDERIAVAGLEALVSFYVRFLQHAAGEA